MRTNHYEKALAELFSGTVTSIEVGQNQRRVFSEGFLKNFDFIIFSKRSHYLADVKGKTFPSGKHFILESSLWQPAKRLDNFRELESFNSWLRIFGPKFSFLLIYPYWIKNGIADLERYRRRLKRYSSDRRLEIFIYQGALYGLLAVDLEHFLSHYNERANHPRLKASDERLLLPLSLYVPEILSSENLFSLNKEMKLKPVTRVADTPKPPARQSSGGGALWRRSVDAGGK